MASRLKNDEIITHQSEIGRIVIYDYDIPGYDIWYMMIDESSSDAGKEVTEQEYK